MKSRLVRALPLIALLALTGCETYAYPSYIERRYYQECSTSPPTAPCGHY